VLNAVDLCDPDAAGSDVGPAGAVLTVAHPTSGAHPIGSFASAIGSFADHDADGCADEDEYGEDDDDDNDGRADEDDA
jgi:hypothetical protein